MKATYWLIMLLVVGTIPAYAQTNSTSTNSTSIEPIEEPIQENAIRVTGDRVDIVTDKGEYNNGDTISITGSVNEYESGKTLALIVRSPVDEVVVANEITVGNNGVFFHTIRTGSSAWDYKGTFQLNFIYDQETTQYNIKFRGTTSPLPTDREVEEKIIVEKIYINLETDKPHYNEGDIITVNGAVRHFHSNTPVTLMVISPNNNIVYIDQVDVSRYKEFSTSFIADGSIRMSGEYIIDALYGTGFVGSTTFQFGEIEEPEPEPEPVKETKKEFSISGYNFDYFITNGTLANMVPDFDNNMINFFLDDAGDGELIISIPRTIADAEGEFIVVVEGEIAEFLEVETTTQSRTLLIPYNEGDSEINIFASYVVPEFGSIVILILMLSIIGVILVTKRGSRVYSSAW